MFSSSWRHLHIRQYNGTSLQAIYRFDIAAKVPIHGEISYVELANLCGIYEPDLRRILRFAMSFYHAFTESRKGYVSHTSVSRAIVEKAGVKDALGVMFDECWQSYAHVILRHLESERKFFYVLISPTDR